MKPEKGITWIHRVLGFLKGDTTMTASEGRKEPQGTKEISRGQDKGHAIDANILPPEPLRLDCVRIMTRVLSAGKPEEILLAKGIDVRMAALAAVQAFIALRLSGGLATTYNLVVKDRSEIDLLLKETPIEAIAQAGGLHVKHRFNADDRPGDCHRGSGQASGSR